LVIAKGAGILQELRVSELHYRAVLEVLDGAVISTVARRYGVSRQTVDAWLRSYARDGISVTA
jgi:transposase-like protein